MPHVQISGLCFDCVIKLADIEAGRMVCPAGSISVTAKQGLPSHAGTVLAVTLAAVQATLSFFACMQLTSKGWRRRRRRRRRRGKIGKRRQALAAGSSCGGLWGADTTCVWHKHVRMRRVQGCRILHTYICSTFRVCQANDVMKAPVQCGVHPGQVVVHFSSDKVRTSNPLLLSLALGLNFQPHHC